MSGAPGSGKTTIAVPLARALDFPLVSKDFLKETIFDALQGNAGDLDFSRRVGAAAMEVMWAVAAHAPRAVLEANFRPLSAHERGRILDLDASLVEVHCDCGPAEASRRFAERARRGIHAAHVLKELSPGLLAEFDGPVGLGTTLRVRTDGPVDVDALAAAVRGALDDLAGRDG